MYIYNTHIHIWMYGCIYMSVYIYYIYIYEFMDNNIFSFELLTIAGPWRYVTISDYKSGFDLSQNLS